MLDGTYRPARWRTPPTPHGRAVHEDIRIAAHESGHAILHWTNGSVISGITIEPRTTEGGLKINGCVWGRGVSMDEGDHAFFGRVVELVAGSVGEDVYLGETKGLRGSDRSWAYQWARILCDSDEARELLVRAAVAEARHVLEDHRHVIDALVSALCEKRTLIGSDVVSLIRRVAGK